jgi:hypothetical protein
MARKNIEELDKNQLLEQLHELKKKLDKKKNELARTKTKLFSAQDKIEKMKVTVQFQRNRILQLYRQNTPLSSQHPW